MALIAAMPACRRVVYDIVTNERLTVVPFSDETVVSIDTGAIDLPSKFGPDKTIDFVTMDLEAINFHQENPVTIEISTANKDQPNAFRHVTTFSVEAGGTRQIRVTQTEPDDALVTATQSDAVNVRFVATSPRVGVGRIELRYTFRVLAHKSTPGTGAGSFLFY